jgi:hypothetical protein
MMAWKGRDQEGQPEPISIGVIVNLKERTVTGLDDKPPLTEPPLQIQSVNETAITFGMYWSSKDGQTIKGASGKLDRLTRDMEVTRDVHARCVYIHLRLELLAVMQANTTDVLIAMIRASPHGARAPL